MHLIQNAYFGIWTLNSYSHTGALTLGIENLGIDCMTFYVYIWELSVLCATAICFHNRLRKYCYEVGNITT